MTGSLVTYADHCTRVARELSERASAFDTPSEAVERVFEEALYILDDLKQRLLTTLHQVIAINACSPYARFVDGLADDVLRTIFHMATIEQQHAEAIIRGRHRQEDQKRVMGFRGLPSGRVVSLPTLESCRDGSTGAMDSHQDRRPS